MQLPQLFGTCRYRLTWVVVDKGPLNVRALACVLLVGWRRGVVVIGVRRMNEVNARRARLVTGWVTVFGRVYHLSM